MENITLKDISVAIALIVGLITGVRYLVKQIKEWIEKFLKERFDKVDKNFERLQKRIDEVDLESCKNYLVTALSDVEQGSPLDDIEEERFWEQYNHYTKLGGNSYIKKKVEQLESQGKL